MDNRKQKLMDLGTSLLAQTLLDLAEQSKQVNQLVNQLISPPEEVFKRFKRTLNRLKNCSRYVGYREIDDFARKLRVMLMGLKAGMTESLSGLEHVVAFYECDGPIFEMCNGYEDQIALIFSIDARDVFREFATRIAEKNQIAATVLKLLPKDRYGVRRALMDCASDYLPEPVIRAMIETLEGWVREAGDPDTKERLQNAILSLAKQVHDPVLFEKTRLEIWERKPTIAFEDIAKVYLECDQVDAALTWIEKLEGSNGSTRDALMLEIYRKQGDTERLARLLQQSLRATYNLDTFQELLEVIGPDRREEVLEQELAQIMLATTFSDTTARFLTAVGRVDEAETYVLKHAARLDQGYYGILVPLAEAMVSACRPLIASLIFRSLVTSVLQQGYAKAYHHGVNYLLKLDQLAEHPFDLRGYPSHKAFMNQIMAEHPRKRSFWQQYEEKIKVRNVHVSKKMLQLGDT